MSVDLTIPGIRPDGYMQAVCVCLLAINRPHTDAERLLIYMLKKSEPNNLWKMNMYDNRSGRKDVAKATLKLSEHQYRAAFNILKASKCILKMPDGTKKDQCFWRFSAPINKLIKNLHIK